MKYNCQQKWSLLTSTWTRFQVLIRSAKANQETHCILKKVKFKETKQKLKWLNIIEVKSSFYISNCYSNSVLGDIYNTKSTGAQGVFETESFNTEGGGVCTDSWGIKAWGFKNTAGTVLLMIKTIYTFNTVVAMTNNCKFAKKIIFKVN